ncbi:hypothetical protein CRV24_007310 [Beauveria bassiana]|nr:hypothetical protein CRV24_007310 [Beauveria bassiana]KAH8712514.1 hypothetical protein HC256_005702 [Beauveria bassiana]
MENTEALSRLNDGDKAELQKFLANEQQRSSIQMDVLEEMRDQLDEEPEARQIGRDMPRQLRRSILRPQPTHD